MAASVPHGKAVSIFTMWDEERKKKKDRKINMFLPAGKISVAKRTKSQVLHGFL